MKICIYGASSDNIDRVYIENVYALGKELAKRKHTLVFGGGSHGLMGSSVKGVKDESGTVIGVSPRFFDVDDILYKDCNDFIYTDTMRERKELLDNLSDAFIAVPGGIGTMDELFEILTLKQLSIHNKPIVFFNINGYYDTLIKFIKEIAEKGFMKDICLDLFKVFDNYNDILDYIENYSDKPTQSLFFKYDKKND